MRESHERTCCNGCCGQGEAVGPASAEVLIRMYRHGFGDCFLLTLPRADGGPFFMLIDCGIYQTATNATARMSGAIADVIEATNGFVDVLVVTHEHWDHVSGFTQAADLFLPATAPPEPGKLAVGEVWMAWTEDPADALATELDRFRGEAVQALAELAANPPQGLAGTPALAMVEQVLGFYGLFQGPGSGVRNARDRAAALGLGGPRYLLPGAPPWQSSAVPDVRVYVLGPPRSAAALRRLDDAAEVYPFAMAGSGALALAAGARRGSDPERFQPFDPVYRHPVPEPGIDENAADPIARFFAEHYYGVDEDGLDPDPSWRRIDQDWLGAVGELALQVANATNNTSLVLAIEIVPTGQVLLFPGDAQVGNWSSWHDLRFERDDGTAVTGEELIKRTVFYKVGHHGSHNATLRQRGLELMTSPDLVAFVPVDQEIVDRTGWRMPLPSLFAALRERAHGRVVRADQPFDPPAADREAFAADIARFEATLTTVDGHHEWTMTYPRRGRARTDPTA